MNYTALLVSLATLGTMLGCAAGDATATRTPVSPTPTARPATLNMDIINYAFESFTISAGTTVTWNNQDAEPHTVTSDPGGQGRRFGV